MNEEVASALTRPGLSAPRGLARWSWVALLMPLLVWAAPHAADCDGSLCALGPQSQGSSLSEADERELAGLRPPLEHLIVTSPYGVRFNPVMRKRVLHSGVDYGSLSGAPVYAAQDGVVEAATALDHFGIFVRMRHSKSIETLYAHLHCFMPGLHAGSVLRRGDIVGFVGESGFATGPHLHYEVIVNSHPVDPEKINPELMVHLAATR
jgi:murein DD-endopeptidase MepM/ murein hydrolase activator NlpD